MRTKWVVFLALILAVAVGCKKKPVATGPGSVTSSGGSLGNTDGGGGGAGKAAKNGRGTFTIGKATTFVTGPVDADGRIDYAAALNERMSKGVTPQNNA